MKQGSAMHSGPSGQKVEPRAHAQSPAGVSQIGMQVAFRKDPLDEGRGFEAPKDAGRTVHHNGSQGRR